MSKNYMDNETLEGVRIAFRNFSGVEGKYNREGDRNFAAIIDHEKAAELERKGWKIKFLNPREEGDEPQPYIPVAVKYSERSRPPKAILITSRGKNNLTEATINMLDFAEIENVDMIIRPYQWDVNGNTGVKAYLQSIYVTIHEDDLDLKYADTPDSAAGPAPDDYDYDEGPHFS